MRKTVDILGIPVDSVTMKEAMDKFKSFLTADGLHMIFTPNAEILMAAQRDADLKSILNSADLLVADGAGVVLASKILRRPVPEKVSGIDLMKSALGELAGTGKSFYFFGSKPGIAEAAAENIKKEFPDIIIAGCRNGYFKENEDEEIVNQINNSKADILLVALGAPKQEKWIWKNRNALNVKICAGVGGTLDVFSGNTKMTPEFLRRNGLEWLHRLCKEPRRAKRMLDLPRFVLRVVWARLTNR